MADKWWRRGLRPKHPYVIAGLAVGILVGIVVLVALLCGGKKAPDSVPVSAETVTVGRAQVPVSAETVTVGRAQVPVSAETVTAGRAQVPVSAETVTPGGAQPRSPKIVGGKPAKLPFIVSIQYENKHRCQGSIVDDKFVSTTAKCVHGLKMKYMTLVMGRSNLDDEGGETREVIDVTINSKWPSHTDWSYDEAVLEMRSPVVFGENIQPVCFADEGSVFPTGMKAAVYGWGNVGQSDELPPPRTLQGVNVTVADRDICNQKNHGKVTEDMLCTGNVAGDKDTCDGDLGAPLVVKQGDDFLQVGTVIWIPVHQCAVPHVETVSLKPSKTFIIDAIKAMRGRTTTTAPPTSEPTPRPPQCGKRNHVPVGRVENGQETHPHSLPWMAYITKPDGTFYGGAVLINESFVVTDLFACAGCYVVFGAHSLSSTSESIQKVMIEQVIIHPNYTSLPWGGMRLARLSHPVNFTNHVGPICVPPADFVLPAGSTCLIAGWGRGNTVDVATTDLLQEGSVKIITNQQCRDAYPSVEHHFITKYTICTAADQSRPSWMDRGGPLMCVKDGDWFFNGVLFWDGCSQGRPALFHNVPLMVPWMNAPPQLPAPIPEPSDQICFKKYEG